MDTGGAAMGGWGWARIRLPGWPAPRVISAAAAVMVVVFLPFVLTRDVSVKQMDLLGRASWWLARWRPAGRGSAEGTGPAGPLYGAKQRTVRYD
jgi:hypothetical protein